VDQLQKAQAECPSLITIVGDASSEIVAKVLNNYYAGEQCWYPE